MSNPPPRPALRRAPDAGMSPAAVVVTSSHESREAVTTTGTTTGKVAKGSDKKKSKGKKGKKRASDVAVPARPPKSDDVEISFTVSKRLRKQLDKRATELGHTREETLTMLVQAWLEG